MIKNFKKILLIPTLLLAFNLSFGILSCSAAEADQARQIQNQRTQAQKQIKKLKLLERIETGKLYDNQKKLEKTENSLTTNKAQYEKAKIDLEKIQKELTSQLEEYNEYERSTSKRIVQIYKSKRSGYVEFLLSSGDLNDFLDRIYYENIIMNVDKQNMARAKTKAINIRNLKAKLEQQKSYLASTIKTMDRQQKTIQNAIDKNERMINKLKTDRAAWEKSEKELAKQSEQLGKFITSTTNKTSSQTAIKTSGNFLRPVSGAVTSPFGSRMHPIFKRMINHTGVDLGMPMGAKVKAANSGKVIYTGWYGGYGKVVIIDHGKVNGIPVTTLYAHLSSYSVSNGASVYKGQIIGNVGSTGYSTGPHLHFEVRENGRPVNPKKYAPI